jgi:hypothetical protein
MRLVFTFLVRAEVFNLQAFALSTRPTKWLFQKWRTIIFYDWGHYSWQFDFSPLKHSLSSFYRRPPTFLALQANQQGPFRPPKDH